MKLPKGITGFRHVDEPELPQCDTSTFRATCSDAVRKVGGFIQKGNRLRGVETNFHMTIVKLPADRVGVLMNRYYPIIAFAVPPESEDTGPQQFIDCPEIANVFRTSGYYEVLGKAELERPASESDLQHLGPSEIDQADYWRPQRLGDFVFNFWD